MDLQPLIIQYHDGFKVVRGDLYQGGIKCRVLTELLSEEIREKEVVYTGCYFGHSGFALGLAGLYTNKRVTLFLPAPERDTYIHRQVKSLNNVRCIVVDTALHQDGTVGEAKQYAERSGAHLLPVGFNYHPFTERLISLARSLDVDPEEVWVSGGSGTTSRCLIEAWPKAKINTVNLGVRPNADMGTPYKIWTVSEKLNEESSDTPPYPSARYYDAKIWRVVREHAQPGALIWNIA